jgi:hypothetical protein
MTLFIPGPTKTNQMLSSYRWRRGDFAFLVGQMCSLFFGNSSTDSMGAIQLAQNKGMVLPML